MRIVFGIASATIIIFAVFLFEGICFRMVEKYALFRLESSWGEKNSVDLNKYLKLLPLNHFQKAPSDSSEVEFSMFRAIEEDEYASKIMGFGRPLRDQFSDYIEQEDPNRKSFAIKDVKHIRGLMLPGLKRFPTDEEVAKGWAGRQRDRIEYAKALFVDLKSPFPKPISDTAANYQQRHHDYFLERGLACLSLPVRSKDVLVNDLKLLKKSFPAVAGKVICRAYGPEAEILLETCANYPFLINMLIVHSPTGFIDSPKVESPPWILCSVEKEQLQDYVLIDGLLDWVSASRDVKFIYPSKIGGLMRIRNRYTSKNIDTFHVPLIMQCVNFYESLDTDKARSFALKESIDVQSKKNVPVIARANSDKSSSMVTDSVRINSLQAELSSLQTTDSSLAYDCMTVREYRQMHEDDPSVARAKNKDLILKIGSNFEQEGIGVLQEAKEYDPLFFHFYQSLKRIEVQSN